MEADRRWDCAGAHVGCAHRARRRRISGLPSPYRMQPRAPRHAGQASDSRFSVSAALFMDNDVAYTSCSSIGQKNNLPIIPIFSINTADHISRSSFGPIIARGGAERVSNLHHVFPQVFMFVLEKRAGHFSPCGCSCVFTVSVGSFEFFDIRRVLSPCPANHCRIHVIIRREHRPVPLPGPCSHLDTRNRQKDKHDQCGSRNSQSSRPFHCLPDPSGNVAASPVYGLFRPPPHFHPSPHTSAASPLRSGRGTGCSAPRTFPGLAGIAD